MKTVSVVGTVGVPAAYGGFETLAENLAQFHQSRRLPNHLVVYCSTKAYPSRQSKYLDAQLRYIGLSANGIESIPYDIMSIFSAVRERSDVILLLGVSGAVALPLVRMLSSVRIVTNIDGIEWKRAKWKGVAGWFLHFSEYIAVRFSHEVIVDNAGIALHVAKCYGRNCHVIAYGGDHAVLAPASDYYGPKLPPSYALALCRIEPENNVVMILEAFSKQTDISLVFVGNWNNSEFGRELRRRYSALPNLHLLDPIYDHGVLRTLRGNATLYIHGHSAGGTNPSLVEMMHFGVPILAFDCVFNRATTEDKALWFKDTETLNSAVRSMTPELSKQISSAMQYIARNRYTWNAIGEAYFDLLLEDRK